MSRTSKKASIAKRKSVPTMETFVNKNRSSYRKNDWVVFTKDENGRRVKPRVLSGSLNRDTVRSSYSRVNGVEFQETRSRRVRNY